MNDLDVEGQRRRNLEGELAAATADAADRVRAQLALAQETLRALLLANAGAIVALFTFIGNLLTKGPHAHLIEGRVYAAFGLFVAGFTFGLAAYFMAFFSQDRFYLQSSLERVRLHRQLLGEATGDRNLELSANRQGYRFFGIGIALAALSVLSFFVGAAAALAGVLI